MGPSSDMPAHARLSSSLQAETRAEFAERSVAKLEKTIDDLEGMNLFHLMFRLRKTAFVSSLLKSTKTAVARLQMYLLLAQKGILLLVCNVRLFCCSLGVK